LRLPSSVRRGRVVGNWIGVEMEAADGNKAEIIIIIIIT
jgi:hypothetical protein